MSYTTLLFDRDADGIAVVTINRPDKLNALNAQVIADLDQLARDVAADPATRALIVTGAGPKAFVAGADISELATLDGPAGRAVAAAGQAAFRALERLTIPVIAAVNGFALGGGCELAMACHIRLATPQARFGQPEVKLGLIPGFGGTVRLPRLVGRGRATEILLTALMAAADEAERIGLVNAVVEPDQLLGSAREMARTILQMSPVATALCLEAVDATLDATVDQGLVCEADAFARACASDDKREGAAAFLAKRAPVFPGR